MNTLWLTQGQPYKIIQLVTGNPQLARVYGLSNHHHHRTRKTWGKALYPWNAHHRLRRTGHLASGMTQEDILKDFPYLTTEDIQACLSYAADRERHQLASGA